MNYYYGQRVTIRCDVGHMITVTQGGITTEAALVDVYCNQGGGWTLSGEADTDSDISFDTGCEGWLFRLRITVIKLRIIERFIIISMAKCKTAVTPLLTHLSYCSFALSHRYYHFNVAHLANVQKVAYSPNVLKMYSFDPSSLKGNGIFWRNFGYQLYWKLSFRQHPVQPVIEILPKQYFRVSVLGVKDDICNVTNDTSTA